MSVSAGDSELLGTYLSVQLFQCLILLFSVCLLHNSNIKEFLRHEC